MKRVFMALLCLALFMCTGALAQEDNMFENVTAVELSRLMGNGTNLGNTLEACDAGRGSFSDDPLQYETLWGQPETKPEMLKALKAAGFDTIRIPVAWMTNATKLSQGDYTISAVFMDRVEQIVAWALEADMFVILNDHWDGGWYGMFGSESAETRALAMDAYKGMWTQIAERFATYDCRLIFEGANEEIGARFDENSALYCSDSTDKYLSDGERYALANTVNQVFVDTVRAAGGNNAARFLLIPGYGTNIAQTCDSRFVMPKDTADDRLLISVHYYDPWSYCGAANAAGATAWGTQKDYADMQSEMRKMEKFVKAGYGVVIGEYGALPGGDGVLKDNTIAYHSAFLDLCDAYDYANCLWDTSGFFVRSSLSFSDEGLAALYAGRRAADEAGNVNEAALASFAAAQAAAPEKFNMNAIALTDETAVAWIMWNDGGWSLSYSVGDTYNPDSVSPGIVATDAVIDGAGTYTVKLDFTATQQGYSASTAFSAIGIANGEILHPGWAVNIKTILINGEAYKMKGRPYTTSDDGRCTRVNLFNEWVTQIPRDKARVMYGDLTGITATPINRNDDVIKHIETIEIVFEYGPHR